MVLGKCRDTKRNGSCVGDRVVSNVESSTGSPLNRAPSPTRERAKSQAQMNARRRGWLGAGSTTDSSGESGGERPVSPEAEFSPFGTVLYFKRVEFARGKWVGVEWDEPTPGDHGGEFHGCRYFFGAPGHCRWVRPYVLTPMEVTDMAPKRPAKHVRAADHAMRELVAAHSAAGAAPLASMRMTSEARTELQAAALRWSGGASASAASAIVDTAVSAKAKARRAADAAVKAKTALEATALRDAEEDAVRNAVAAAATKRAASVKAAAVAAEVEVTVEAAALAQSELAVQEAKDREQLERDRLREEIAATPKTDGVEAATTILPPPPGVPASCCAPQSQRPCHASVATSAL